MDTTAAQLPTAAVADAAVRLGIPVAVAPVALTALLPGRPFHGPAAPVTHLGSVDVLLETIDDAPPGAVLVVDNGGRHDEACVGDLMLLEAKLAGMAGAVIWGLHRDTTQLREIGLPSSAWAGIAATNCSPRRDASSRWRAPRPSGCGRAPHCVTSSTSAATASCRPATRRSRCAATSPRPVAR